MTLVPSSSAARFSLPAYARLLGIDYAAPDDPCLLTVPFADVVLGRPGFLHGGAIAGLLEMAAVAALYHALADAGHDRAVKPVNMTVDFMRGGREAPTFARGMVSRLGTRVANVDVLAWQDDADRPIARAHMNFLRRNQGPD